MKCSYGRRAIVQCLFFIFFSGQAAVAVKREDCKKTLYRTDAGWAEIYARVYEPLHRNLTPTVPHFEDREDLIQDTILSLFLGGKKPEEITIGLAIVTAKRRLVDLGRKKQEQVPTERLPENPETGAILPIADPASFHSPEIIKSEAEENFRDALNQLSPLHYSVFRLFIEQLTPEQVAAACRLHPKKANKERRALAAATAVRIFDEAILRILETLPNHEFIPPPPGSIRLRLTTAQLEKAVADLPEDYQKAARMIYVEGRDNAYVARKLDVEISTVVRMNKAIRVKVGHFAFWGGIPEVTDILILDGKKRRAPEPEIEVVEEAPEVRVTIALTTDEFQATFKNVSDQRRQIATLVFIEGLSPLETAHRLKCEHGAVSSAIYQTRKTLRDRRFGDDTIAVGSIDVVITDGPVVSASRKNIDLEWFIAPEKATQISQGEFDLALSQIADPKTRLILRLRIGLRWKMGVIAKSMHMTEPDTQKTFYDGAALLREIDRVTYARPRYVLVLP